MGRGGGGGGRELRRWALGGALLLGGVRRVFDERGWTSAAAMGVGASILACTRPYEGLLVTIPVGLALVRWLVRPGPISMRGKLGRVVLPGACVAGAGLAWMLYYNWRVTGDPMLLPHTLYAQQHPYLPAWVWRRPVETPPGLDRYMMDFARVQVAEVSETSRPFSRALALYRALAFEAGQLIAPLMLLILPWAARQRWMAFAAGVAGIVVVGMFFPGFFRFHYHAPAAPLTIILAVGALRQLALRRGRFGPAGRALAALLVALTLLNTGLQWINNARRGPLVLEHWMSSRQSVIDELTRSGGRHVVFVRYGPNHSPHI